MFIHREGKKNHTVVRSLCYRTLMHSGATAGHSGVSGWWQPREGMYRSDGARMWVRGQGHSTVSTHLFSARGFCLGGVLGCLQPGEGATAPFSVLQGSLTGRKDLNKAQAGGSRGTKGHGTGSGTSLT